MDEETLHLHYTFHHDGAMSAANNDLLLIKKSLDENKIETIDYWTKSYPIICRHIFCIRSSGQI